MINEPPPRRLWINDQEHYPTEVILHKIINEQNICYSEKQFVTTNIIAFWEWSFHWRVHISPYYLPLHKQHGNHIVTDDSVISKACLLNDWMINYKYISTHKLRINQNHEKQKLFEHKL